MNDGPARFDGVASTPYAWPFDGRWGAADTALLVIDAQRWLTAVLAAPSANAPAPVASNIERLVTAARAAGLPLIFTRRVRDADPDPLPARRAANSRNAGAVDAMPPLASEAAADLAWPHLAAPHDVRVDRASWNAFTGSPLSGWLVEGHIRNLVFAGFTTDGAVHATMRKANDAGFECLLLEDACAAACEAHHRTILDVTRFGNGLFGATASTQAFIDALSP